MKNPFKFLKSAAKKAVSKIKQVFQKPKEKKERKEKEKKERKQKYSDLNEKMREWEKYEAEPNEVKATKSQLEEFYKRNDLNPKDKEEFDYSLNLTKDQQEELDQIADATENKNNFDVNSWEYIFKGVDEDKISDKGIKSFEALRGTYGIDTYQDFINFYENMIKWTNDKYLSFILTSDQVAELIEYADEKGFDDPAGTVMSSAYFEYTLSGKMGGDLYDFIREELLK